MTGQSPRRLPLGAKLITRVHRGLYRLTGGRLGSRFGRMPILLLTTTGRRSGEPRTTPLTYLPDDGSLVLIASNGGSDRPPAWLENLKAQPRVTIQVRGKRYGAMAAIAGEEERARRWPLVLERYPAYRRYQENTAREIPLVILRPAR
jgi:deazaflavin-dependent oxidoreductase (nitroreductase family)